MMPELAADLLWKPIAQRGRLPILVVRHGQTQWNAEHRFLGRSDIGLNATGRAQVTALGQALAQTPLAAAYSSPLSRAAATAAAILAGRTLSLQHDSRLAELDQGDLEGRTFTELLTSHPAFFRQWQIDPASCRVPGGETFVECQQRGMAALTEIAQRYRPGPPVLVVTHNMLIRALVCAIRGLPLSRFREIEQENAAANLLSYGSDGLQIHQLNLRPLPGSP